MPIIEYLPVILAAAGIALRFRLSRDIAQAMPAAAPQAAPAMASARTVNKAEGQRPGLALA